MQKSVRFFCVIMCQLFAIITFAIKDVCSEYIDVEAINNMDLVMNYSYAFTGTGTSDMPGTGSGTMTPCTGSGTIGGWCFTQFDEPIESVNIELGSLQPEYPKFKLTDGDGNYVFQDQAFDFNYSIYASRDYDVYNGLSTLDAIKIVQIIFGFGNDLSPYSYIAADVNQDQQINLKDAIALVKLLIGIKDEFEGSKSWIFVDANQQFVEPQNPWPFNDRIDLENINQDTLNNNFIGVKLGDVSGNADPSALLRTETRANNMAFINVQEQFIEKGKLYTLYFNAEKYETVAGMQLFLEYNQLEVLSITGKRLNEELSYHNIQEDKIFMSWYGHNGETNKQLFSIDVKAEATGKISDFIQLNQNWLSSELYLDEELDPLSINLRFLEEDEKTAKFSVDQNTPNPFIDITSIDFWLPETDQVKVHVFDQSGKLILTKTEIAKSGWNQMDISKSELSFQTGIFTYLILYQGETQTKKMIMIE